MNELSHTMSSAAPPVLELRNVTKFYGSFKAVDDLTFSLPRGSICGFLGPNGAGKTTTIRMILEIIKPNSGTISILGHSSALDVASASAICPRRKASTRK